MEVRILPADIAHLEEAADFVEEMLEPTACPMRTRLQIRLAVEEIFVNIASYAYPGETGEAELSCELLPDPNRIRICFSDSGIPFDPLKKEDADTSEKGLLGREGGLGILLVKKTMDRVEYTRTDGKNRLSFEKIL